MTDRKDTEKIIEEIRKEEIIKKVLKNKGRWLQKNKSGYPLMQLSEVEKCMFEGIEETENRILGIIEDCRGYCGNVNEHELINIIKRKIKEKGNE